MRCFLVLPHKFLRAAQRQGNGSWHGYAVCLEYSSYKKRPPGDHRDEGGPDTKPTLNLLLLHVQRIPSTQFYRLRDPNPTLRRSYMNLLRYWCSCFADFWKWWWYRDNDYAILPTMADACKIRQPPFDILSITENLKKVFD